MTNKEIARAFNLLGKIMELHDENPFKIRSYASAYITIRKLPDPLNQMNGEDINNIQGIGKAISEKIQEFVTTGEMQTLNKYLEKTPKGIVEMLSIKGFGPKKIKTIWKDLGIETIGELIYAVNENRLVELKGFGRKTQDTLKEQLEYYLDSVGKWHYAVIEPISKEIINSIKTKFPDNKSELTGQILRKCDTIDKIEIISTTKEQDIGTFLLQDTSTEIKGDIIYFRAIPLDLIQCSEDEFNFKWVETSCTPGFWKSLEIKPGNFTATDDLWKSSALPVIIPEFREDENINHLDDYRQSAGSIIEFDDIKGCVHNHSTYSDGMNTLKEMVEASIQKNHEYFVITDHSRSAFYANGLSIERLYQQLDEIRSLDQSLNDIRVFSGIESDILNDGNLDYPDDVLAELDVVIASIHSNLKMDEQKATKRLITAIENPYTSILGHPTGRLLLSRQAYPVDHKSIIDACADNNVAIEINANPNRLDLDWRWINYAMEKDVLLSINPDAHSIRGIDDIYYGVCCARKGGLKKYSCLNAFDLEEFEEWMVEQHEKRF